MITGINEDLWLLEERLTDRTCGCPAFGLRHRPDQCAQPIRWDECAGCRAGIKHIHCHNPWQDDGGG